MSQYTSLEDHDLRNKCSKLGPPDVFRQEVNQKEDRMSQDIVRQGYQYTIPVGEHEYSSGRDRTNALGANQLIAYFCDILAKKNDVNTSQEARTKKPYSHLRDIFTPSIPKYKEATDIWFKNLADRKPLQQLSKGGIPVFNKLEEVLHELYRHDIPIVRAVWFIKLNALYATILAESNKKKARQLDPSVEWAQHISKAMLELFQEIVSRRVEAMSAPSMAPALGMAPNAEVPPVDDPSGATCADKKNIENAEAKFRYLFDLMVVMYDQGLLDRAKILNWWIGLLEKYTTTDQILKFILPYLLQIASYFAENEILCRRLLHWSTRCLSAILYEDHRDLMSHVALPSIFDNHNELSNCPLHRTIIMSLGGVVTSLCQLCPSAVVWTDARSEHAEHSDHYLHGSPLDALPCPLSHLPLPHGEETTQLRKQLELVEAMVSERSINLEQLLEDRPVNKAVEDNINRQMRILECLDQHNYGVVDNKNSMGTLFENIFPNETAADGNAAPSMEREIAQDAPIIIFLSEWAVTPTRTGIHRPVVAATLLEKLRNLYYGNAQEAFQEALVKFLDVKAPYLDPNNIASSSTSQHDEPFKNLICLFGELIDRDIFSHDSYVRYLIAKGEVSSESAPLANANGLHPTVGGSAMGFAASVALGSSQQPSVRSDFSGEDNDKLSFDNPDSVRSELSGYNHFHADTKRLSRHIQYLTHFPFLQDEANMHEANQRAQLLYGSGRAREQTRANVKRLVRDITKLFTKRMFLIDATNGELVKGKKRKEGTALGTQESGAGAGNAIPNVSNVLQHENCFESTHEDLLNRFKALTYFDMESVIYQCNPVFMDAMKSFTSGATQYIPCVDNFSFFFELIELSLNVTGLVQTVTDVIQNLQYLDAKLDDLKSPYRTRFISSLCLNIVGLLRKYHNVLMTMDLSMYHTFTGLVLAVRHLAHPDHCTSTQRCILVYLHELFQASKHTRTQYVSLFSKASCRINNTLFKRLEPAKGGGRFKADCLEEAVFREPGLNFSTAMTATVRIGEDSDVRYTWVCELFVRICHVSRDIKLFSCFSLLTTLSDDSFSLNTFQSSVTGFLLGSVLCALCSRGRNDCTVQRAASGVARCFPFPGDAPRGARSELPQHQRTGEAGGGHVRPQQCRHWRLRCFGHVASPPR